MINEIAKKYNIPVIGDAAQSFGASKGDVKVGTFADITTTSFFPAKPLGCYGDGDALFTNSQNIEDKLRSLRVHGKGVDKYDNIITGALIFPDVIFGIIEASTIHRLSKP